MKELQAILRAARDDAQLSVLATLAHVEGSSYRRAGARLWWRPGQAPLGSISGGCLEEDVIERAKQVQQSGQPQSVVYDTTNENDLVWGVGLGCHGIVHVLLEPVRGQPPAWRLLADAWRQRQDVAWATVYEAPAGHPLGTVFALTRSGQRWQAQKDPDGALESALAECLKRRGSRDWVVEDATGRRRIFCEYLPAPLRLTVFGAGDDARPLVRLAKELGWLVRVVDPRREYATALRFPEADEVLAVPPDRAAALEWDARAVAVVMTHHYRFDVPLLRQLLPLRLPYLGLLGPKKRAEKILSDLETDGLPARGLAEGRLHAPVGLDLGGGTPEEVAFAILAEVLATFNERDGRPLHARAKPIHA